MSKYAYTHTYIRCSSSLSINQNLNVRVLQLPLAVHFLPGGPAGMDVCASSTTSKELQETTSQTLLTCLSFHFPTEGFFPLLLE